MAEAMVTVSGDASGGWIVEVHTGDVCDVWCVRDALDADAAKAEGLRLSHVAPAPENQAQA